MPNRLAQETSPYLLQHADNPVDWYPWGETAFRKAQAEDKPVFISIGYSACHWCHVMAHESFEDPKTAAILNESFVCVKVDREERPDLDHVYMAAVQAMTGSGGWPMSVFATPDGLPFYGGTYFPPVPRHGLPSFPQILRSILSAWTARRQEILSSGNRLVEVIARESELRSEGLANELNSNILSQAEEALWRSFDRTEGGWGNAPKFPQAMVLEFLMRHNVRTGSARALEMVTRTLDAMARGGIYDQLGGGFHRYAVDARWATPHFEKMLYDNAQLARAYLHAWQLTGTASHRVIAEEVLDYVVREMTGPSGEFFSSQDADSEGSEGKFFVWTMDGIRQVLGDQADDFVAAHGVTRHGNFEGTNVLQFHWNMDQRHALAGAKTMLFRARQQRVRPTRDEKVLTSWNGLMTAAFAEAARTLNRGDYRQAAERNAAFLLRELRTPDGRLLHTWRAGTAKQNGFLEDYAFLVEGLLELYQTTFEPCWFVAAYALSETMTEHFQAPGSGFYDTSDDHETLITRPRGLQDHATPSGSAMAVTVLLKLAGLAGVPHYVDTACRAIAQMQQVMAHYPLGFGQWLQALSYALSQPRGIAIVGDPESTATKSLLHVVRDGYRPFQVVAMGAPDAQSSAVPLLEARGLVNRQSAAYVCRNFTCQAPITEPEGLRVQLEQP